MRKTKKVCKVCQTPLFKKRLTEKSKFCSLRCSRKQKSIIYLSNKKICLACKKDFNGHHSRTFCSKSCYKVSQLQKNNKILQKKYKNKLPTCKECGFAYKQLFSHFQKKHSITYQEYLKKWNPTKNEILIPELQKLYSDKVKGEKNPAYNHGGRLSPYSKNFIRYKNLTESQKQNQMDSVYKKNTITRNKNNNDNTKIDYYTSRGFALEEAKQKLKERQITFSKEICIKKYGKKKGLERWKERQNKWMSNFPKQNFSNISQELFWFLYDKINQKYKNIYFATLDNGIRNNKVNKEFKIETKNTFRKLDFYIQDTNKCIEFDGTYWHGEKGRGNKTRDDLRDKEIIKSCNCQIFHVKEKDYKENKQKIIKECEGFING